MGTCRTQPTDGLKQFKYHKIIRVARPTPPHTDTLGCDISTSIILAKPLKAKTDPLAPKGSAITHSPACGIIHACPVSGILSGTPSKHLSLSMDFPSTSRNLS
eukprot:2361672-Amphidinium_carterae.1